MISAPRRRTSSGVGAAPARRFHPNTATMNTTTGGTTSHIEPERLNQPNLAPARRASIEHVTSTIHTKSLQRRPGSDGDASESGRRRIAKRRRAHHVPPTTTPINRTDANAMRTPRMSPSGPSKRASGAAGCNARETMWVIAKSIAQSPAK